MGISLARRPVRRPASIARPRALTASAEKPAESVGTLRRLDQAWQREALRCYRVIGECSNPAQYQGRAMERIRYFPAVRNERGVPIESDDPTLRELFNRIRTPGGGPGDLSELAGAYSRLQFVIGDGLLTVSLDEDDDEEVWEYLSPMEMRLMPDTGRGRPQEYRRYRAPGATPEELEEAPDDAFEKLRGDDVRVSRLWRRHIEYSQWADSPVRPIVDLYTMLERLTLAVNAEASSRAAQRGLLFVPNELSFSPADKTQDENPDEDALLTELRDSYARAIANPGSAEAMMPFVMRAEGVLQTSGGAVPMADLIKHIPLGPTDRYTEIEAWDKTISRIASSLDLPKEMLTGIEDVSHWSAWFLDEVGFRQHTGPVVLRFCNDLASAYLRPAAREAGVANADRVTVWFDPAQAVNHPDETGTALKAHDQLIFSDAYTREKLGASEDAAPDEEEYARRFALKIRQVPDDLKDEIGGGDGETPPPDGGRGGDANDGPPDGSESRPPGNRAPSPGGPSMSQRMIGAALMQVERGRELAGNRLVRRAQSCDDCRDKIKDVPPALVAAALGPDQVRTVIEGHTTEAALVDGIGAAYARVVRGWGIDSGYPEQLGVMVEQHAIRTLYERDVPPLPAGFLAACQKACS